ncbi:MAG: hypothetical protein WAW11_05225 [Patescibacteria group bacterium]
MDIVNELKNNSKKFNKIVIWGFRRRWHTHRFIFQAYYENLKKCGIPVVWVEDEEKSKKIIEKNDLILSASGMHGKMVPEKKSLLDYHLPIRDDVYYCLHAENDFFIEKINFEKSIKLKFYSNEAEQYEKIYETVHFDSVSKTLYQPWGTNLLPHEFNEPVFCKTKLVFWIGSIWKGKNKEGNISEIFKLKNILRNKNLFFIPLRFVPNSFNKFFIRHSRLAPAIGGEIQVHNNYLPCRMFKNISYGQLGFSNIEKFNDIFLGCNVYDKDNSVMIDKVLSLSKEEYIDVIKKQQLICKQYTIAHHLNNIFKYLN